jgi:hypothetical protein
MAELILLSLRRSEFLALLKRTQANDPDAVRDFTNLWAR